MITPKYFLEKWNKKVCALIDYDVNVINSLMLPKEAKEFLLEAGLPESAVPFLNFESSAKGGAVKLTDKYNFDASLSKYVYLGFTGAGDFICVTEKTGEIVCLEHENTRKEIFINSSIPQLADSLLEYADFVKKVKSINGRRAFLERNAPQELIEWITKRLEEIDSRSLKDRCFWREELNYYKKNY